MTKRPLDAVEPRGLKFDSVLMTDADSKSVFALCTEPDSSSKAVIVLNKKPWTEAEVRSIVEGDGTTVLSEFHRNDKFSKYNAQPPAAANEVAITLICPANEIDIAKYSQQTRHAVRETPQLYAAATLPFVQSLPAKQTEWVRKILRREKEMEVLMYEDAACMLLPDTKWDRKDASSLYTLAIIKDGGIRSVRDLTGAHVPMLRALRDGVQAELLKRFGVRADQLRCYMHYLPSFWHAHIHFAALTCPGMGASTAAGKAILLEDIIDWLERDGTHFQTASLSFVVGDRDPLYKRLVESGALPGAS
tara:strand:- start:200 stop:1114 length:915 start_codon:yes stop_codon:yes gene_type:complete